MSLMPTWLIGICRVSARLCTSSTVITLAFGATAEFMYRPDSNGWRKKPAQFAGFHGAFNPYNEAGAPIVPMGPRIAGLCTADPHFDRGYVLPESAHGRFQAAKIELRCSQ